MWTNIYIICLRDEHCYDIEGCKILHPYDIEIEKTCNYKIGNNCIFDQHLDQAFVNEQRQSYKCHSNRKIKEHNNENRNTVQNKK